MRRRVLPAFRTRIRLAGRTPPRQFRAATHAVPETVSVVIPTRDAGPEFAKALDAISAQTGLGGLELIVVDSGSTDGTPQLARSRGARVLEVPPGEFRHGPTRNRGAELSTGDILVMTVQDAFLVGEHALRDLVHELRSDEKLAAVSARQIPRPDSDLYAAYILWVHDRVMEEARARVAQRGAIGREERRAEATVEDVCAAIRRSVWEDLRFRDLDYGEDLDFGLRAVAAGWKVARSRRAAVIHSHTRGATYHLRRSAVDQSRLPELLGEDGPAPPVVAEPEPTAAAARRILAELEAATRAAGTAVRLVSLSDYLVSVAKGLAAQAVPEAPSGELAALDELLDVPVEPPAHALVVVRTQLVGTFRWEVVHAYAKLRPKVKADEAKAFVAKLAATVIGAMLGESIRTASAPTGLAQRLTEGV